MKTIIKLILSSCTFYLFSLPFFAFAQSGDNSPLLFHHDDDHYIRAHDNHKYFQEYTNFNGKTYMYYNKTYNNNSKDLYFYEVIFDSQGKVDTLVKLVNKDDDFSSDLYFEKDINMNNAFFGVDNYLFVVVQNNQDDKNQLYRLNLSTNQLDIVDLDNNLYDRYFAAVCSGYDVILFTRKYAESYTYKTTDHNLHFNKQKAYPYTNDDAAVVSAVMIIPPDTTLPMAYAALKIPETKTFHILSYRFNDMDVSYIVDNVFEGKAMRLVSGRSFGPGLSLPDNTDGTAYISMFSTKDDEYKDDKSKRYYKRCPIIYGEIKVNKNDFTVDASKRFINLPSEDYYASDGDDALIDIVENYVPGDYTTFMDSTDGFRKQNILVNCDKSNETNYSVFPGDYYRLNPSDPPVQSNMINYTEAQWKNTWTLIGLLDGAPPCSLDWHAWDSIHIEVGETAPTELSWGVESEKSSETSATTEISWSLGAQAKTGEGGKHMIKPVKFAFDGSAKYAQTNESVNTLTNTSTTKIVLPMPLTEENQQEAFRLWLVPTINRVAYSTYDWSDTTHPISDRIDYAFITSGYTLKYEPIPISSAPHNISDANEDSMNDWKERGNITNHNSIAYHAFEHALSHSTFVSYNTTTGGTSSSLIQSTEQSCEQSVTKGCNIDLAAGIEKPEVFTIQATAGFDYNYTTSSTLTTKFTNEVEFNLTNLTPGCASVIYPETYTVYPYLFTQQENFDWWYFADTANLLGFKPWYIAYTVSLGKDKSSELLSLIKPEHGDVFYVEETVDFWWKDSLQSTKLVISNEPSTSLKAIVYTGELDTKSANKVNGLEPGTYFWRVAGVSKEDFVVWSDFRKFTVVEKDFLEDKNVNPKENQVWNLPAKVYPNPTHGQNVSVAYEVKDETAPVVFTLYDISGVKLWEVTYEPRESGLQHSVIHTENLSNRLGILRIVNGKYIATEKIVVFQ